jgi:hypothetical protein
MRLRRTAAGGIVVALALAGCGSGGGGSTGSSVPETTTASAVATTTTVVATTTSTAPAPTTTTVVADATAADPKVLAEQLQAVLDRFRSLYAESRTDPALPFESQELQDEFLRVVTRDFYSLNLLPRWSSFRNDGVAVRDGPGGPVRSYITSTLPLGPGEVVGEYCTLDDSVTYAVADGSVTDDHVVLYRARASFTSANGAWFLAATDQLSEEPVTGSDSSTCRSEAISR